MKKQPTDTPVSQTDTPVKKKRRNNRTAGHNYERKVALELRPIFPHIVTSRSESKTRDDDKIDLMNKDEGMNGRLPYNIQCKESCEQVRYVDLLFSGTPKTVKIKKTGDIKRIRAKAMPRINGIVNVVFHRYISKKGTFNISGKFMAQEEFAILTKDDFLNMVRELEELRKQTAPGKVLSINPEFAHLLKGNGTTT